MWKCCNLTSHGYRLLIAKRRRRALALYGKFFTLYKHWELGYMAHWLVMRSLTMRRLSRSLWSFRAASQVISSRRAASPCSYGVLLLSTSMFQVTRSTRLLHARSEDKEIILLWWDSQCCLKEFAFELSPVLADIYNSKLEQGYFPSLLQMEPFSR